MIGVSRRIQGVLFQLQFPLTKTGGQNNRVNNKKLLTLFLIVFIDLLGFGIILPLLPFYAESFGVDPHPNFIPFRNGNECLFAMFDFHQFFFLR